MKSYTLDIAAYKILFQAKGLGFDLEPSLSQSSFIAETTDYDIAVNVLRGKVKIPPGSENVFRAPYLEEINGVATKKSDEFWTVYKHGDYILVHTTMPLSETINEAMIVIRPGEKGWDIILDSEDEKVNPLAYPLDGLLLYYLTALNGDIFIHGSGIEFDGRGILFTGQSGKGKTTIARLFDEVGATVIHDDRLIIRKIGEEYLMFNTPVYELERSNYNRLDTIYSISHGQDNRSKLLGSVDSLTTVMSNCIQHHWNAALIGRLTNAIMKLTERVEVKDLAFLPDNRVVDYIKNDS
jgi:hypothetical protein